MLNDHTDDQLALLSKQLSGLGARNRLLVEAGAGLLSLFELRFAERKPQPDIHLTHAERVALAVGTLR